MNEDLVQRKEELRAEAKRARSLLTLDAQAQKKLCENFFTSIDVDQGKIIASYWPVGRELDTHLLMDECIARGARIALPVIQKDSRILKFALWDQSVDVEKAAHGICQPVINKKTKFVKPDIVIVPLLAFDRSGVRLGFGGGYYDTTLEHLKNERDINVVGWGYAKQACLFNLPAEKHDVKMDWVITEQSVYKFV